MAEPFIGEIRLFSFSKVPRGWALCNGQVLQINQNQALFAVIGAQYGGDGRTNFQLPDLRGKVPVHFSSNLPVGTTGGEEAHTLTLNEMPQHTHQVFASSQAATARTPVGNVWATRNSNQYGMSSDAVMNTESIMNSGNTQSHNNMQPYNTGNYCIALQGIFPSRN